ncbi:MAG: hypothetical protein EZS28_055789, partial [Streblomastix strix]
KTQLGWLHEADSWKDLFSEAFPHLKSFASDALTYLLEPVIRFLRPKDSDQEQFGGNKTGENLSEFIANTTMGLVASVLNLFSSMAEQYASSKPTNFFNPSDGIAQGELAALGGSGQRGKKKKKSKKGSKDKEVSDQAAQAALAAQALAAAKQIPAQHYKFPVVPGASLRNKRFYDDQYTQSIASKHFTYAV